MENAKAHSGPDPAAQENEVRANYEKFEALLPALLTEHRGQLALLRHAEIVEFFDTANDAYVAACKLYPDGLFSIQEVTDDVVDLGFFSHAVDSG